jgi:hypothetical protein
MLQQFVLPQMALLKGLTNQMVSPFCVAGLFVTIIRVR